MYANYPFGLTFQTFIGLQAILVIASIIVGLILVTLGMPIFFLIPLVLLAFFTPIGILNGKVEKRQNQIKKDTPPMINLLSTSLKAGVELPMALALISDTIPGPLGEELRKTQREISAGVKRSVAFNNMARRTGVDIIQRFVDTINTAEESGGMSISDALENFSEDVVEMQLLDIKEKAQKLPNKMLLPIFLCIFLPFLIIICTPVVFSLLETL